MRLALVAAGAALAVACSGDKLDSLLTDDYLNVSSELAIVALVRRWASAPVNAGKANRRQMMPWLLKTIRFGTLSDDELQQLQLQRLKKKKLMIKDSIERLKDELIPDLNA